MKLHLGCGNRRMRGFVNIDVRETAATDLVCDALDLPHDAQTVERIETYHMFEHLSFEDANRALREWYRVLKPGGVLVIECPDFDQNVRDYLRGNNPHLQLLYIFGRQRFEGDAHGWGWNVVRLTAAVLLAGFSRAYSRPAEDYHTSEAGCLRVEAVK